MWDMTHWPRLREVRVSPVAKGRVWSVGIAEVLLLSEEGGIVMLMLMGDGMRWDTWA